MIKVGAYDAKTHLSGLLEKVQAGESVLITRHGKAVAILSPANPRAARPDAVSAIAKWRKERKGVRLGTLKIRELIEQGRP
jgi:prevent-host-death family protein